MTTTQASYAARLVAQYVGRGNVIVIPNEFVTLCGRYEVAALLSQLLYWYGRMGERPFYKTDESLQEELRLSEYQLRQARKKLEPLGITTVRKGLPPRLYYHIDTEVLGGQLLLLSAATSEKSAKLNSLAESLEEWDDDEKYVPIT